MNPSGRAKGTDPDVILAPAGPGDMGDLRRLLEASGLPVDDVGRSGQEFLVARSGGELVGCAGVELYGGPALLRSLAVSVSRRGERIGDLLLRAIVEHARKRGARELFALTTTIEPLLARRGFTRVERAEVPEAVRQSAEFSTVCPGSAACMRLAGELRRPASGAPAGTVLPQLRPQAPGPARFLDPPATRPA